LPEKSCAAPSWRDFGKGSSSRRSCSRRAAKAQAGWVASSFGIENVTRTLRESISAAERTFADLKQPTKQQVTLKGQLDAMAKTATGSEGVSTPRTRSGIRLEAGRVQDAGEAFGDQPGDAPENHRGHEG